MAVSHRDGTPPRTSTIAACRWRLPSSIHRRHGSASGLAVEQDGPGERAVRGGDDSSWSAPVAAVPPKIIRWPKASTSSWPAAAAAPPCAERHRHRWRLGGRPLVVVAVIKPAPASIEKSSPDAAGEPPASEPVAERGEAEEADEVGGERRLIPIVMYVWRRACSGRARGAGRPQHDDRRLRFDIGGWCARAAVPPSPHREYGAPRARRRRGKAPAT